MHQKTFISIVSHLFPRRQIEIPHFDSPTYGGLPVRVYKTISPEAVDAIQNMADELVRSRSKNQFAKIWHAEMSRLGEPLNFPASRWNKISLSAEAKARKIVRLVGSHMGSVGTAPASLKDEIVKIIKE